MQKVNGAVQRMCRRMTKKYVHTVDNIFKLDTLAKYVLFWAQLVLKRFSVCMATMTKTTF